MHFAYRVAVFLVIHSRTYKLTVNSETHFSHTDLFLYNYKVQVDMLNSKKPGSRRSYLTVVSKKASNDYFVP